MLAWSEGENWFIADIKVLYPVSARQSFSVLLILLGQLTEDWDPGVGDRHLLPQHPVQADDEKPLCEPSDKEECELGLNNVIHKEISRVDCVD